MLYADDLVAMARFIDHRITGWIEDTLEGWMGLQFNREKTRVVELRQPGASLDLLGYTFRIDQDRRPGRLLQRTIDTFANACASTFNVAVKGPLSHLWECRCMNISRSWA